MDLSHTDLDEGGVQIDVMGHDDGSDNTHCLKKFLISTALTIGEKHPLQHLFLVRTYYHIL